MPPPYADRATALLDLHRRPELLRLVNVWDPVSARVVAESPGTVALATASHSIAATLGYPDGEVIPRAEMLQMCGRIAAATDLPVTADLEGGYGNAAETVRRALDLGIVGANIEDQLKPLAEAAAQVESVVRAVEAEGVSDFVLNARTDVLLLGGDRPRADLLADTLARGRAYLDAGAPVVFVPGAVDEEFAAVLIEDWGPQRLSLIGSPGSIPLDRMERLGVARVSYGPFSQRVALAALRDLVGEVHAGGGLPGGLPSLN